MSADQVQELLSLSMRLQEKFREVLRPPEDGYQAKSHVVIPSTLVRDTRGYIEIIANQINGCYEQGWYDACAVMIRRLVETLLIETFEQNGIADKIKNSEGDFLPLDEIIKNAINETEKWNLSRDVKRSLPRIKKLGDRSAHSRRFNARRTDLEKVLDDVRLVVEELLYIAKLRK